MTGKNFGFAPPPRSRVPHEREKTNFVWLKVDFLGLFSILGTLFSLQETFGQEKTRVFWVFFRSELGFFSWR